jgi:hypothetical protein
MVAPGGLNLPDCQDGSLLGLDGNNNLTCVSAPAGSLNTQPCTPQTQAINSSDGMTIQCVNKGTGTTDTSTEARIQQDQTNLNNLQNQITAASSSGNKSFYQGLTTNSYNGQQVMTGGTVNNPGIASAAAICAAQYGTGAHMCTVMEIYDSVALAGQNSTDKFDPTQASAAPGWVYMVGWNAPVAGPQQPTAGLADNCGSATYPTADRKWQGMQFVWQKVNTGFYAPTFNNAACNAESQIACCK